MVTPVCVVKMKLDTFWNWIHWRVPFKVIQHILIIMGPLDIHSFKVVYSTLPHVVRATGNGEDLSFEVLYHNFRSILGVSWIRGACGKAAAQCAVFTLHMSSVCFSRTREVSTQIGGRLEQVLGNWVESEEGGGLDGPLISIGLSASCHGAGLGGKRPWGSYTHVCSFQTGVLPALARIR